MHRANNVLYDMSYLGDERGSGVERYAIEILNNLISNDDIRYTCLVPKGYPQTNCNISYIESPFKNKMLNHLFVLPFCLIFNRFNAAYFPAFPPFFAVSLIKAVKIIRTIHDDVYWSEKETLSRKAKFYLKPLESFWLDKYAQIVTVSNYSKTQLAKHTTRDISVVSNAVNALWLANTMSTDEGYLLCVGTIEPRKNYSFAINLFEKISLKFPSLILKICGRKGWAYEGVFQQAVNSSVSDRIELITDADDCKLAQLYGGCTALIFPSKSEGFGIPLIEAMTLGKLVIAAQNTAITEVVTGGGVLIEGFELQKWEDALESNLKLLNDKSRIDKARSKASSYSWRDSSLKLDKIIKTTIGKRMST